MNSCIAFHTCVDYDDQPVISYLRRWAAEKAKAVELLPFQCGA
jgi:hypothetical protein